MKLYLKIALGLGIAGYTTAVPIQHDNNSTNSSTSATWQILQFALTLEHLENTFYSQALAKLDQGAFAQAGFAPWVRGRFEQISEHEQAHVALLSNVLGNNSVAPCSYSLSVLLFALRIIIVDNLLARIRMPSGSQFLVTDTEALTISGSILSVEAQHASWIKSAVFQKQPWSGSFDTPLDGNMAYTLAMNFITQCPSSNPPLPFRPFPSLNITTIGSNSSTPCPGDNITVSYPQSTRPRRETYLAFLHGLNTTFTKFTNLQATIPSDLQGLVYAVVTDNNTVASDDSIVAGPAPLMLDFDDTVPNY